MVNFKEVTKKVDRRASFQLVSVLGSCPELLSQVDVLVPAKPGKFFK